MAATTFFPPSPALATVDPVEDLNDADLESLLASQPALSKFPTPPTKPDFHTSTFELLSPSSSSAYTSPRPAFTDEASLDDLTDDDLDAFLLSQGALSHWPTPPPNPKPIPALDKEFAVEAIELLSLESPLEEGVVRLHGVIEAEYGASLLGTSLDEGEGEGGWDADVDSLDGLSEADLHSLLAEQGGLSKWPTPPTLPCAKPRDSVISCGEFSPPRPANGIGEVDCAPLLRADDGNANQCLDQDDECDEEDDGDVVDHLDVATVFARTLDPALGFDAVLALETLLIRSALPPELLAMAYNIISASSASHEIDDDLPVNDGVDYDSQTIPPLPVPQETASPDPVLQTLASLSLAAIWAHDTPPSSGFWVRHVSQYRFCKEDLEKAKWSLLDKVGGRMLDLASVGAVDGAMDVFERRGS